jgi:hypothetical protein
MYLDFIIYSPFSNDKKHFYVPKVLRKLKPIVRVGHIFTHFRILYAISA